MCPYQNFFFFFLGRRFESVEGLIAKVLGTFSYLLE